MMQYLEKMFYFAKIQYSSTAGRQQHHLTQPYCNGTNNKNTGEGGGWDKKRFKRLKGEKKQQINNNPTSDSRRQRKQQYRSIKCLHYQKICIKGWGIAAQRESFQGGYEQLKTGYNAKLSANQNCNGSSRHALWSRAPPDITATLASAVSRYILCACTRAWTFWVMDCAFHIHTARALKDRQENEPVCPNPSLGCCWKACSTVCVCHVNLINPIPAHTTSPRSSVVFLSELRHIWVDMGGWGGDTSPSPHPTCETIQVSPSPYKTSW